MAKAKYSELQHRIANDLIDTYRAYKNAKDGIYTSITNTVVFEEKIELLLSYLDKKMINNSKLSNVHLYVQCLKKFHI